MSKAAWTWWMLLILVVVVTVGLIVACGDDDDDDDDSAAGDDDDDSAGDDDSADDDDDAAPLWHCIEAFCETVIDCGAIFEDVAECVKVNENTPYDCESEQGFVDCACACSMDNCDGIDPCLQICLEDNGCVNVPQ